MVSLCDELGDEGLDGGGSVVAGDRDAVVSVVDEISSSDFVKLDRGKGFSVSEGSVHALPSVSRACACREEFAVEGPAPTDAADDPR